MPKVMQQGGIERLIPTGIRRATLAGESGEGIMRL